MSARVPRILAHRGASGRRPENSLAAFREAVRLGADGVELDVHTSADGMLVVHHDPEVAGVGLIEQRDLVAIRAARLPNGEPVPTLAEALAELPGMEVWIELKTLPASADARLLETIEHAASPERYGIHSFDHRIVARLGSQRPGLRRGILSSSYPLDPIAPLLAAGASTLWQEWHLIDEELVTAIHRRGGEIIAWTLNDRPAALRLAGFGVDALCGNYPERLRMG
ncbi:MAG TPA: glycerophosphodiester phosphodiesterase [Gemmatimonadales bacterium]|nr:glycerophosphodiester phosphodiesterase [Gemmatimonadales bacterium]